MLNPPPQEVLNQLPGYYATQATPLKEKIIFLHFFCGPCDWFAAEFDGNDVFFEFVNLNDPICAEWGPFLLSELKEICVPGPAVIKAETGAIMGYLPLTVEWDQYWTPKPFGQIDWENRRW